MRLRPPRSTRTYTLFPYPPLFRSRRHVLFALFCLPLRACRRAALTCRKSHESREVVSQFRGNPITHDIARSCSALDCPRNTAGLGKCPTMRLEGFSVTVEWLLLDHAFHERPDRFPPLSELGRTSCRERVCQSV